MLRICSTRAAEIQNRDQQLREASASPFERNLKKVHVNGQRSLLPSSIPLIPETGV